MADNKNLSGKRVVTKIQVMKPSNRFNLGGMPRSVVILERQFDADSGIQVGTPRVAPLAYDPEITSYDKVLAWAQSRNWEIVGEPNSLGLYAAKDLGPKEQEEEQVTTQPTSGEMAQANR